MYSFLPPCFTKYFVVSLGAFQKEKQVLPKAFGSTCLIHKEQPTYEPIKDRSPSVCLPSIWTAYIKPR
jgi:hypothetical protein